MPSGQSGFHACAAVALGTLISASDVQAAAMRVSCQYGSLVREIELRIDNPARGAPCEVVYRKLQEEPGNEQVLWTAQRDGAFCQEKSMNLISRLEDGGWLCEALDQESARLQPSPPPPPPPARRASRENARLQAAVARDLAFLKDSAEGEVEAEIGDVGDLNGDGSNDAAVLITFDNDGANHKQYLVAYVDNGTTYRATASTFIGGRYRDVYGALVDGIQNGVISLEIQVLKDGDPYCCPTGSERIAFQLEEDELVRLP